MKSFKLLNYLREKDSLVNRIKELIADGIDPSENNNYALQTSSNNGLTGVVKLLLSVKNAKGETVVDPTVDDNYAITTAVENNHAGVVEVLLNNKLLDGSFSVDPSCDNNYLLKWSSREGYTEIVELLLNAKHPDGSCRVDASAKDNYAIVHASLNKNKDIVEMLQVIPSVIIKSYEKRNDAAPQDFHENIDISKIVSSKLEQLKTLTPKQQYIENKTIKKLLTIVSDMNIKPVVDVENRGNKI